MRSKFHLCHLKVDVAECIFAFPTCCFTRCHCSTYHPDDIFDALIVRFIGRRGKRDEGMGTRNTTQNTTRISHITNITSFIQSILWQSPIHTPMSATVRRNCLFSRKRLEVVSSDKNLTGQKRPMGERRYDCYKYETKFISNICLRRYWWTGQACPQARTTSRSR